MSLQEIYDLLNVTPYTASWDGQSICIDFGIDQLRIRKSGSIYTITESGKMYLQNFQNIDLLLDKIKALVLAYQVNQRIATLIEDISQWLPMEITWPYPSKVELKFADISFTIHYLFYRYRLYVGDIVYGHYQSLQHLKKDFQQLIIDGLKVSADRCYLLLAREYIEYQQQGSELGWLIVSLVNQNTELLLSSYILE